MKPYTCYLSLGANLGERGETLREALRSLAGLSGDTSRGCLSVL